MAEFTLSGYKATIATALTTELDSLANGSVSALSAEIDNSTTKYLYADIEVSLDSLTPASGGYLQAYLVPSIDGTNYPKFDTGASPSAVNANYYIGPLWAKNAATAQIFALRGVQLPAGKFKLALRNVCGVALASSGNTMSWRPYNMTSA